MEMYINWVLGDINQQYSLDDYLVGSVGTIPQLEIQDEVFYQYNQGMTSYCTLYASMTGISNVTNYKFTDNDIKEILSLVPIEVKTNGRYLYKAVDTVRNRYNRKFPDDKVVSLLLNTRWQEAIDALGKGYTITTTFNYNLDYFRDANDGRVEWKNFKPRLWGHAINLRWKWTQVIDNYFGKDNNIYWIRYYNDLVENGVFSQSGYIFVKELSMEQKKENLKRMSDLLVLIEQSTELNSKIRWLTNDQQLKTMLHDLNVILKNKANFIKLKV